MKRMMCILLLFCTAITIAMADTILMKNGLKIEGDILKVGADSVTIRTASGVLTIAAADIERIETTEARPEEHEIREGAIPRSIYTVGFGCLGGAIAGGCAGIGAVLTDGYGTDPEATTIIIIGASIAGILAGVLIGSR